jgi:hypothetical protein
MDDEFKKIIRIILKPSTIFVLDKDIILLKNKK